MDKITFQLRAVDLAGLTHTTHCNHNATRQAAVAECKRFFPADLGYKRHQALTLEDCEAELGDGRGCRSSLARRGI